jgi:UPF0716 family protein affecting phage T7 exclusion
MKNSKIFNILAYVCLVVQGFILGFLSDKLFDWKTLAVIILTSCFGAFLMASEHYSNKEEKELKEKKK